MLSLKYKQVYSLFFRDMCDRLAHTVTGISGGQGLLQIQFEFSVDLESF